MALLGLLALGVLLPSGYAIYIGLEEIGLTELLCAFFARHLLSSVAALYWRRMGYHGPGRFAGLFILPSLVLFHTALLLNGVEELWPPILAVDLALFLPAFLLAETFRNEKSRLARK